MRINSVPPKELYTKYIHVKKQVTPQKPQSKTDKAELTTDAKTFSTALNAAKEAIKVRTPQELEKIDRVKAEIENNTYKVSGREVAKKILGK